MRDLRQMEQGILANGRVDGAELKELHRQLYVDGKIDRKGAGANIDGVAGARLVIRLGNGGARGERIGARIGPSVVVAMGTHVEDGRGSRGGPRGGHHERAGQDQGGCTEDSEPEMEEAFHL